MEFDASLFTAEALLGLDAIEAIEAIDGTPVLDLKPWMSDFAPCGLVHEPASASERMRGYWRR
jgi:tRNA (Thr-GGU) A37 N-methylase